MVLTLMQTKSKEFLYKTEKFGAARFIFYNLNRKCFYLDYDMFQEKKVKFLIFSPFRFALIKFRTDWSRIRYIDCLKFEAIRKKSPYSVQFGTVCKDTV